MNAIVTCPMCGHGAEAPDGALGRRVRCPSCRAVFRVTDSELKPAEQAPADEYAVLAPVVSPPLADRRREVANAEPSARRRDSTVPASVSKSTRSSLPGWRGRALGAAVAMTIIITNVLIRSFRSAPQGEPAKAVQAPAVVQAAPPPLPGSPLTSPQPSAAPSPSNRPDANSEQPARPAEAAPVVAEAEPNKSQAPDTPPGAQAGPKPSPAQNAPQVAQAGPKGAVRPETPPVAQAGARRSPAPGTPPPAQAQANTPPGQVTLPLARAEASTPPQQPSAALVERGKRASALVELLYPGGQTSGSAFCIDKSGRFITNAHVVEKLSDGLGKLNLIIDIGLKSQRTVPAKVLRTDDYFDLALLKVDADPRLETLELGDDQNLSETSPVLTFGFPFGKSLRVGHEQFPNCTVVSSKVTALHGRKERREAVQYDGQINPGNSGGAVVDASGRVIGIAVATLPGKSINFAIPVGRLSDFLAAPGVVFTPPSLLYRDRSKPVTWSIRLEAPAAGGKIPAGVSVRVTVGHSKGDRRSSEAKPAADGSCRIEITPVPRDPPNPVRALFAMVEVKQGSDVLATVYRRFELQGAPHFVVQKDNEPEIFIIRTLRRPRPFGALRPPEDSFVVVVPRRPSPRVITPQGPSDDGMLTVSGALDVNGEPKGAGRAIRPPSVSMGEARIGRGIAGMREVRRLPGHTDEVMEVAVSPHGERLVSGSFDSTVRVWDAVSGRQLHLLKGHKGEVTAVAISPDGRRALSGGADQILRLWDIENGKVLNQYRGHGDWIFAIAFTPDGRRAISAGGGRIARAGGNAQFHSGYDRDIWVRDLETGKVVARWHGHDGIIDALCISHDGRFALSSSSDKTARLWEVESGRELKSFPGQQELDLHATFSPDGNSAIVASSASLIRVFEVPGGRERLLLRGHTQTVDSFAVSPDSRVLISGSYSERMFRIWDLRSGQPLGTMSLDGNPVLGGFTPDGRRVFWGFSNDIREYAAPQLEPQEHRTGQREGLEPLVRELESPVEDLAVGGGGRYLCLRLVGRALAVFDVNAASVTKTIELSSGNALIAAGVSSLLIADPDKGTLERRSLDDPGDPGKKAPFPIQGRIKGLAMGNDSDGPLLAAWSPNRASNRIAEQLRFSFLDPKTFAVLKAGPGASRRFNGYVSPSGGSFMLSNFTGLNIELVHIRASAGGSLFGIWHTGVIPSGFQTLSIRGATMSSVYNHESDGHLAPGPDGRIIYTGLGGVRDSEGKPLKRADTSHAGPIITIPSPDPAYYLGVAGLAGTRPPVGSPAIPMEKVHALVQRADQGEVLFRVIDLEEMCTGPIDESMISGDFTVEKRFHLIPAAKLLITIPFTNDKIVIRRLDVESAASGQRPVGRGEPPGGDGAGR
jgi:S1-C subfamily serine protease